MHGTARMIAVAAALAMMLLSGSPALAGRAIGTMRIYVTEETDTLVDIRRVAALSAHGDTVLGSAWDDLFLSGRNGNKSFDGRNGQDEWRYAGAGAVTYTCDGDTFTTDSRTTCWESVSGVIRASL